MSAASYTNKIRTRVESNEQKVQQPGRIANFLPMLPANGCSANYNQINYVIPCPCDAVLPVKNNITVPLLINTSSGAFISPTLIFEKTYYFVFTTSVDVTIRDSKTAIVVCVGAGGDGAFSGGDAGQIQSDSSITNNTVYSVSFGVNVSFGAISAFSGASSVNVPGAPGLSNPIGLGMGGNPGISGGFPFNPFYTIGYSGEGYGAGGGGDGLGVAIGAGGYGGLNPDLYFGVSGLNVGMPQSTLTTSGSPGVVILALQ